MKYIDSYTKQSIKSNQIKSNQIKSNQIKSNQIKSNQIKSNQIKSTQMSQQKSMEQDVIDYIANNIDEFVNDHYEYFCDHGLKNFEYIIFYQFGNVQDTSNLLLPEEVFVTLPTDKREYYNLMVEVIKYYMEVKNQDVGLIIDLTNLFSDGVKLSHLYGMMIYDKVKDRAIQQYLCDIEI